MPDINPSLALSDILRENQDPMQREIDSSFWLDFSATEINAK